MRKLTAGNKSKFTFFAIIIISIIAILIIFLNRALNFEKEEYAITKDMYIYDNNYEYIELTGDAVIQKKWTGNYYLSEPEAGTSYNLGSSAIAYDSIKERISLYGNFYEVALDGQVNKTDKKTDISDMLNSKLYKIEDRKYLLVSKEIATENSSLTAENYLIIILDKSGNTLLLNNSMDIKTINAIVLETDTFKFDVANEKLINNNEESIDLKKIIGSTNQYIVKNEEEEENNEKDLKSGETSSAGGGMASSYSDSTVNIGGSTIVNQNGQTSGGGTLNGQSTETSKNVTKVVKSASLRSVTPGANYLDISYIITDAENRFQVVYININGGGITDTISLDKSSSFYRITGLKPNTDYKLTLGYKEIKSDNTVEEVTEDILDIRTEKLSGKIEITKVTPEKIYFNLKLDVSSDYKNGIVKVYVNGIESGKFIKVNTEQAITNNGWTSSINKTDDINGRLTLKLENVKNVDLVTSTQIY